MAYVKEKYGNNKEAIKKGFKPFSIFCTDWGFDLEL